MERRWYVRLGMVAAVVLGAIYLLIPTYIYFTLPQEVRNDAEAFEEALPSWAPSKRINLGLDLQGGVHLVLGVDIEKAERDKISRRADEFRTWADGRSIPYESIQANPARGEVRVSFADAAQRDAFRTAADEYFQDMRRGGGGLESVWTFRPEAMTDFRQSVLDQALRTIRNRIDRWGVSEPTIAKRGADGILVQLPGFKDPGRAKELLGRTAQLEFRLTADEEANRAIGSITNLPPGVSRGSDGYQSYLQADNREVLEELVEGKAPEGTVFSYGRLESPDGFGPGAYRTYLLRSKVEMTGDMLTDARVAADHGAFGGPQPYVSLSFDSEGARLFGEVTGANIGRRLAIVLDDTVNSAPVIQSSITDGNAQITLGGGRNYNQIIEEANELVLVLRSGALPAPVTVFEERTVGASLGPELIRNGTYAVALGIVLVMILMAVYYKVQGLIANVALVLNGLLILAALATVGATLTLPGIAGFILTLGMAVDANVLISERIREELREGKAPKIAVTEGYGRAFTAIFDSNLTTLIAAFVLLHYGSGPVRGFAVTLSIGIVASFFTAIVVTRIITDGLIRGRPGERISV